VFLDVPSEDGSGAGFLRNVKEMPRRPSIVTARSSSLETAATALKTGACDYLTKPFENLNLVRAVASRAIDRCRLAAGEAPLLEEVRRRNEALERANRVLRDLAIRDGLTGVFTSRFFRETLQP